MGVPGLRLVTELGAATPAWAWVITAIGALLVVLTIIGFGIWTAVFCPPHKQAVALEVLALLTRRENPPAT